MTEIVDIRASDAPEDVVHRAVTFLNEGRRVILPTAMGYVFAGDASSFDKPIAEGALAVLSLRSPEELLDFTPDLNPSAERLIRRSWPGPIAVQLPVPTNEGLIGRLPTSARQRLAPDGFATFLCPSDEVHRHVSHLLGSPLLAILAANESDGPPSAAGYAERLGESVAFGIETGPPRFPEGPTVVRFNGDQFDVVQEGVVSAQAIARLTSRVAVFVCTGNTCRSPMAEGLFRKILAERLKSSDDRLEERGYIVMSAGIAASPGLGASPESVEAVRDIGVDISSHLSRPLNHEMIRQADWIFTMTRQHREAIVTSYPEASGRIQVLSRDGNDVVDPIGQSQYAYDTCRDQIEQNLARIADEILSS